MATPDAEDASPSPEYSADYDDDDMAAEQQNEQSPDGSPTAKPTNGQKANAKDPLRPRRKKARRACYACQRAHLTCSEFHSSCSSQTDTDHHQAMNVHVVVVSSVA